LTDRVVEPRLQTGTPWTPPSTPASEEGDVDEGHQKRGLRWAGLTVLGLVVVVSLMSWGPGAPFRGDDGSFDPLLRSLVAILFLSFLLCGLAYGIAASTIRSDKDAVKMMDGALAAMGSYIVLAFFAAVFIALFSWSNLGLILSVSGAEGLKSIGFVGLPLLIAILALTVVLDVFIGSASAKWAILAPVLVPMLMQVGIAPEWTQAVYRLGDSITNPVTPLLPYFPLILVTARRYASQAGIGSIIALMLPYSIWFGISSTLLFAVWYALDLPLGP
jgi:aminobenzoyl-glutamate transport protein